MKPTKKSIAIGYFIRRAREKKGFTQYSVADLFGTSQPAYNKVEQGLTQLSSYHAGILCDLLEIPHEEFSKLGECCPYDKNDPANEGKRWGHFTLRDGKWVLGLAIGQYLLSQYLDVDDVEWIKKKAVMAKRFLPNTRNFHRRFVTQIYACFSSIVKVFKTFF